MFQHSVTMSQFAAGSSIDAVQKRVAHLEAMIGAVGTKRRTPPKSVTDLQGGVHFKDYLGGTTPPPKVRPLTEPVKSGRDRFQSLVQQYSVRYGVDSRLVNAVIRQESGFNPNAVSSAGAQGLMQLMPATAKGLGVKNSFDPSQNIEGGVKHLSQLLKQHHGNVALALASYNAGSGAVAKYNGIPPYKETQHYVRTILAAYLKEKNQ